MHRFAFGFRLSAKLVVGAVFCAISGLSASADSIAGNAVAVRPKATVSNSEGTLTLRAGMDVAMGDKITTGRKGEVQLVFSDDTRLVVGRNSTLIIEAYLLRSKSRANNFTVRALGGSFRMITGKSNKKAYKIKTPTATIGVRGTSFDFTVKRDGETGVVLFNGEARICGQNGRCQTLNRVCSIAQATRNNDVRVSKDAESRIAQIRGNFPYVVFQQSLRRDFRVQTRGCGDITKTRIDTKERTSTRQSQRTSNGKERESSPPSEQGETENSGNGDSGSQ